MAGKIRVGIVGATVTPGGSGWGARAHVPALKALPNYELLAVCTAHPDTALASAREFGAELAYHDFDTMLAQPDIDLVVVSVRVPGHYDLVMRALEAGKAVFCEWPLGRTLEEAEQMEALAKARSLRTAVGLQARSDPVLMYARDLVQQGYVGEVLATNYSAISEAITERGSGRIWQHDKRNGANTLRITAGHAIDAMCYVLGDFTEVTARLDTKITRWHNPETDETVVVDSPDWVNLAGRLQGGAEVQFLCATVPANPSGSQFEIYGTEGTLVVGGSSNSASNRLMGARGKEPLAELPVPEQFTLVPGGAAAGQSRNVAQAYVRFAAALASGEPFVPNFTHAVKHHRLIDAIERSAEEGRTVPFQG